MHCPECGVEYREGFDRCHDCDVALVSGPDSPDRGSSTRDGGLGRDDDQRALVPVLRTTDPALLPVVKSLLQSADIPYFVQGEEAMGLFPLGPFGGHHSRSRLGAVIHVPPDRVDEVRELLQEELDVDDGAVQVAGDRIPEGRSRLD